MDIHEGEEEKKVPVTVLSGFLGSGKTTFLRHILTVQSEKKIAVIQNEFGESIGIEEAMVMGSEGTSSEWLELPNGCVCCSVRGDLVLTVEGLLSRRKDLDHVIIETTGLADPGRVASCFWLDNELESQLFLDSIVTIVDSKHITLHLDGKSGSEAEAARQVAFADRIILNKIDLIDEPFLAKLQNRIRSLNPTASLLTATYSKVKMEDVLNINAFSPSSHPSWIGYLSEKEKTEKKKVSDSSSSSSSSSSSPSPSPLPCQHEPETKEYGHMTIVSTHTITTSKKIDEDRLTRWLGAWMWKQEDEEDLAQQNNTEIYRTKGMICLCGSDMAHWLQGVHTLFEIDETDKKIENDLSKIVVIGRGLKPSILDETFHKMVIE